jgi:exonuclease SbcD
MERLRARFPHTLVLRFQPAGPAGRPDSRPAPLVGGQSDFDVISRFFTDMRGAAPDDDEAALLKDACDACRVGEDLAS